MTRRASNLKSIPKGSQKQTASAKIITCLFWIGIVYSSAWLAEGIMLLSRHQCTKPCVTTVFNRETFDTAPFLCFVTFMHDHTIVVRLNETDRPKGLMIETSQKVFTLQVVNQKNCINDNHALQSVSNAAIILYSLLEKPLD